MTRARMHLVMYGNTKLLSENEVFAHLLKYVREKGDLIDVPEKDFCEGSFSLN
jgi:superfamily I DNA and/or RNA helicase